MAEQRPVVLCVEDDEHIRALVERILSRGGCDPRLAAGVDEALRLLEGPAPDLILTDVMMPRSSGYDLCAALQADPRTAMIPVVFLTALDSAQDKARAMAAGAVEFLVKPVSKEALLDAVRRHAHTRGRWDGLKAGMAAAAWRPAPEDLDAFRRSLGAPEAPGADLYALAPGLGLTDALLAEKAASFLGLPYLPRVDAESIRLGVLPPAFCRANRVLAIQHEGQPAFAVADPFNRELAALLERYSGGAPARLAVTEPANLSLLLRRPGEAGESAGARPAERPIVDVAEEILETAVRDRASDIHVEPKDDRALVRFRVDGAMRDVGELKPDAGLMMISRFKALAGLDVAERRKPQDGSMKARISGREFIVRLATTCTPAGESLILRLLEPWAKPKPLEELGMAPIQVRHMVEFAHRNHGLILVAGPTGSGKTTTIYSLLQHIDCRTRSLISVEDPVEYRIPSANQQQVDEKAGLTFEALLKSSMRQDPDILFLGEMRDPFSAKMAIDFASTGHLTISSIHTTNATTAVFRLERLGVTRGAMSDSILGVVAQKLLRRLCACKRTGPISAEERAAFAPFTDDPPAEVARPVGCGRCGGSGYLGREGVYEIVKFYPEISDMIRRGAAISEIRDFARRRGDLLAPDHALEKVRALVFSPGDVIDSVLLEESEYRRKAPAPEPPGSRGGPDPSPAAPSGAAAIVGVEGSVARVLVVDDDADTRAVAERLLVQQGYAVTTARDGVEALSRLSEGAYDLILSDLNMPGMDGLRLMELKIQKGVSAPVVFLTSQADAEARALGLGAADYVLKPVSKDVLLARVRRVLKP